MLTHRIRHLAVLALLGVAGCSAPPTATMEGAVLESVAPAGGAAQVQVGTTVVIRFSHVMGAGMEAYAALHEGGVTGSLVPGLWSWSADRRELTFVPATPLKPQTRYTIHLGGGMRDAGGRSVNMTHHGPHMGGQWMSGHMMSGGMMGGGHGHVGAGWRHENGSYGMTFSFTTA
jgi:hypothetical protein